MTPSFSRISGLAILAIPLLAGGCATHPATLPAPPLGWPQVDHHIHVFSPETSRNLEMQCAKTQSCFAAMSTRASTGAVVVAALDAAHIGRGVLLSNAYFFASPSTDDPGLDVAAATRRENSFIVEQARASCGRLIAVVSVNPLADNALDEIAYWGRTGGTKGVKFQFGNSAVDLRSPDQVRRLAEVFAAAADAHLAIVVHLQGRSADYGAGDVRIFLRDVLPAAKRTTVQIAHAGGGGGVDAGSLAALGVFADAIERDPDGLRNLYFDLAMVPDLIANVGKLPAAPADVATLEGLIRRIGLDRFLMASDWTEGLDLNIYYAGEKSALAFTDAEWRQLQSNVAPFVPPYRPSAACRTNAR